MTEEPSELDPETVVRLGCIETLNRGGFEKAEELYTDDPTYHTAQERDLGLEDLIAHGKAWQTGFPDLEAEVTETVVGDDRIAFEYVVRGTHEGNFADVPPTGKSIESRGIGFAELEDGLIDEYHLVFDRLGLFQDMGLV